MPTNQPIEDAATATAFKAALDIGVADVSGLGTAAEADTGDFDAAGSAAAAQAASQPLDSDLTAYAGAADAAARRALIGAVGTAAEITDALQGAEADPTRIGAEYMPETIEGVFELTDATGTVIADNQIANVNGLPAVGDGSTLEGMLLGQRIVRATGSKTAVQLQSAVLEKLVSLPVSGERLQNQSTLWMEIAVTLNFSDVNFPQTPYIYATLTDYSGFVAFASVSELTHLSCLFGFGAFPLAHSTFQATGQIACNVQFIEATPPFVTLDKYRIRQNAAHPQGGIITTGTLGEASAFGLVNNGEGGVATASKAPSTAEDCLLSFYLGIPASAGETRTLDYSITVKAEW